MKIGIAMNAVWNGRPIVDLARAAEAFGFDSLWMGEHIFIPVDVAKAELHGTPLPDSYKHMPDVFVWLTAAAVVTNRIKLGFDICLVPERNPLHLAKELASLDQISNGRVIFGVGVGWIEEEAKILGYDFKTRWPRTLEFVRALKTLWTEEKPSFQGEHISFPAVYSYPKPVQRPHPPIILGAGTEKTNNSKTIERVAKLFDGWLPVFLSPAQAKAQLAELKEQCAKHGRDYDKMDITLLVPSINFGIGERPNFFVGHQEAPADPQELIRAYEDAGVKRLMIGVDVLTKETGIKVLEDIAKGLRLY